ncbi:helix-turn-helix domain-containing protein [Helicobacter sp. NHP22-001]|uniref:helix-turn-helix domain-containing protein n=1 Tax=Helicobacter sp. NHP22-001 TaxID=3040202 RepID=UPI00244D9106|nr:helix-turn-helix domain-containing protein [Helicobacter sp. NHP22-001]GMB95759.1 Helix-turn-helix domain-containing protein [Helicobacter sp. NHP22-001]
MDLSFNEVLWIAGGGVVLVFVCLVTYSHLKDKEFASKTKQLEKALDTINQEIYKIRKWIQENEMQAEFNASNISTNVKNEVNTNLNTNLTNLYNHLQEIQDTMHKDRDYLEEKIIVLENKFKELGHFTPGSDDIDEKRVIQLFQDGHSIDSIAKELRISKGQIEFVLKLADLQ